MIFPYLTRTLGVHGFGHYAIAISICALMLVITDFGFALSGTQWLAKYQHNKASVAGYLANVICVKILLILMCGGLLIFCITLIPALSALQALLTPIIILAISQTFQTEWVFLGIEKIAASIYPFIIGKLFFVISVISVVRTQQDSVLAIYSLATGNLLATLISGYLLYNMGFYLAKPQPAIIYKVIKQNVRFFLAKLATSLYSSSSTFIVGFASGVQAAGIYSAAEKLYVAGQALSSPVSQALYPYLARTGDKKLFYVLLFSISLPFMLLCLALIPFSVEIIRLIYGDDFIAAADILTTFLFCMIINFINVNFGYPAFSAIGKINVANNTVFIGGLAQLILISERYLTNNLTATSVAYSILYTEILLMLLRISLFFMLANRGRA